MSTSNKTIKVSWQKNERKIFGAFKWNAYVLSMYEEIFQNIKDKYGWDIQYGAKHILKIDKDLGNDIKTHDVKEFVSRNKQLYDVFVAGIASCDLFIADITNHNPNVLLELGIAVQLNKNILIVTSQDIKDLPFDIRGLVAKKYQTKDDLQKLIEKEIRIFTLIKDQNFDSQAITIPYKPNISGVVTNKNFIKIEVPKLKNLRIQVDFRFIYSTNHKWDWFGVHLRSQGSSGIFSELALVRYTGETRSLTWPEQRKEKDCSKVEGYVPGDWHTFDILIDENRLTAWVHQQLVLEDSNLMVENFGEIYLRCNDHRHRAYFNNEKSGDPKDHDKNKDVYLEVEYRNIKVLDLSTTANLFE